MFAIKRWIWSPLFVVALTGIAACERGPDEAEDVPIVVEESEPIALGESQDPTAEEVQLVDDEEPRVITRTVVVRERPIVRNEPSEDYDDFEDDPRYGPTPARSARISSIPAGISIPVTLLHQVDSEHHDVGSSWSGRVTRDVVVGGQVVIPGGSTVTGVVTAMDEGDPDGRGFITLDANSIETVGGTRSISATPASVGQSYEDRGFPVKETAIGAGAGAVLGGIVGGKKGAAIGAAAGGAGGAAMGTARNDYEVAAGAGTGFSIRLENSISL
jgi:hypothetical protein